MTKKRIIIVLVVIVLLAIGGMAVFFLGNTGKNSSAETGFYNQAMGLAIATEDGFYHMNNRNFLYFYDFKAKADVRVCNKPNCTHEEWEESTPDEERCHSYLGNGLISGFLSWDQLYIIQIDPMEQTAVITASAADRSGQRKIAEVVMDHLDTFVVNEGKLYLSGTLNEMETDENGFQTVTGETDTWLYSVDLDTGKQKELTPRGKGYNAALQISGIYNGKLYCREISFKKPFDGMNFEEAGQQVKWFVYDIEEKTYEETLPEADGSGGFYMAGNTLLYDAGENWGAEGFEKFVVYEADLE